MKYYINLFLYIILSGTAVSVMESCQGCSNTGRAKLAEENLKNSELESNESNISRSQSESELDKIQTKNESEQSNKSGSGSDTDLPSLFRSLKPAVFLVYTTDGTNNFQGSGFFVSSSGIAVSNYHVFEGTTKGLEKIRLVSGKELKIEKVLEKSEENDYIIFKVRNYSAGSYIPVCSSLPEVGEEVFAIGNPHELEHTLSKGLVSGYRNNNSLIQTNAEITHGSSGGPLMNMRGEVIGITSSGQGVANLNFAVNISLLKLYRFI